MRQEVHGKTGRDSIGTPFGDFVSDSQPLMLHFPIVTLPCRDNLANRSAETAPTGFDPLEGIPAKRHP